MKILYKCACMPAEAGVEVRERAEGEDIVDWMESVQGALGADHTARSPRCRINTLEYAKIPMPENAPFIGGSPRLHS